MSSRHAVQLGELPVLRSSARAPRGANLSVKLCMPLPVVVRGGLPRHSTSVFDRPTELVQSGEFSLLDASVGFVLRPRLQRANVAAHGHQRSFYGAVHEQNR